MITTEQLKSLRDETGVSIMQCKKALEEAQGDIEKARIILKKKSGDAAAKKADRELGSGIVTIAQNPQRTVMLTLLCETDFVAKNEDFMNTSKMLAEKALTEGKDVLAKSESALGELIQKIGENIKLGEVSVLDGENIGSYNHNGQYGALISLKSKDDDLAKDIAMHTTAMRPAFLNENDIPEEAKEKAKEIFAKEVEEQSAGKDENMKAKILEGKVNSYFKEQVLLKQSFIKDPSKTIEQLLKEKNNEIVAWVLAQI